MKELYSEIMIDAPAQVVWQLLTDFDSYPQWNPFILRASGEVKPGARLDAYLKPPGGMGVTIKPKVLKAEPDRELRWLGHFLTPGVFDGEHIFTIEPLGPDQVRFVQREEFKGWLAPLMLRLIGIRTQCGFGELNRALKAEAERQVET